MTAAQVLAMIDNGRCVPVNVDVTVAIAAYQQRPCEDALRVILLAQTPEIEDSQQQLDFLSTLPATAWPADCREQTLAGISRNIGWRRQ